MIIFSITFVQYTVQNENSNFFYLYCNLYLGLVILANTGSALEPPAKIPRYQSPHIDCSPSLFASSSKAAYVNKTLSEVPLYCHFFAIEAYNQFIQLRQNELTSDVSVKINGVESKVSLESLNNVYDMFLKLRNLEACHEENGGYLQDKVLLSREQTSSALFARAVDQFLFSTKKGGACFHQLPSRCSNPNPESPDLYVVTLKEDILPVRPLVLSDLNLCMFPKARTETAGYVASSMEVCSPDKSTLVLGLPLTPKELELQVCIGVDGKLLIMTVCSSPIHMSSRKDFRALCCTLYGCVHSLIEKPVVVHMPTMISVQCCDGDHKLLSFTELPTVVHCQKKNVVLKYYSKQCTPDKELMELLGFEQVEVESLSDDGVFQVLKYKYIEGVHEPRNIAHVIAVIKKLDKLHCKGFVHGDIRSLNLLFCTDNKAYIIDLDFAAKEGTRYKSSYNSRVEGRHSSAGPDLPMKKAHDRYSLHYVITKYMMTLTQAQKGIINKLLETEVKLEEIVSELGE